MSNPGHISHLVEPGAGILQPPRSIEAQYMDILRDRDRLKEKYDAEGISGLGSQERVQLAAANIIEAQLPARCRKAAAERLQQRVNSTKLADRFLCAVFPPYLSVKPDSFGILRAAKKQLLAEYNDVMSRWAEGDMRQHLEKVFADDIARAGTLEKPLTVGRPLTLKRPTAYG